MKKQAKYTEYKVAKMLKGKRVPLSGASWLKGDVITDDYLIEVKSRMRKSSKIWINPKWIEQVVQEAKLMNKKPALVYRDKVSKSYWFIEITDEPCSPEKHSFEFFDLELCLKGRKCRAYKIK